jgi:uncharacterized protein (TIGR02453 family)
MTSKACFSPKTFKFLRELKANNRREWFLGNKERYETEVRDPMLEFIAAFAPRLKAISRNYVADPRPSGGSMFRIHRDTRFSSDKSPWVVSLSAQKFPSVHHWHPEIQQDQADASVGLH